MGEEFWVNFKVWGLLPITFIFTAFQIPLINKYKWLQKEYNKAKNIKYISLNLNAKALYKGVGALTPSHPNIKKPTTKVNKLILLNN